VAARSCESLCASKMMDAKDVHMLREASGGNISEACLAFCCV
jgi:hypothetical protein